MTPADEDKLRELATTVAAGVGYDLEELSIVAAGRRRLIRIVVDSDHGVNLDGAAEVSRAIADSFDTDGDALLGDDPYTLEVTSPGIGRPLTEERHFRRATGRLVKVTLVDGSTVEGRVRRVVGSDLELLTGPGPKGTLVPLADVRRAKVDVEFAKMPAVHADLLAADGFVDPARAFDDVDAELDELDDDDTELEDDETDVEDDDGTHVYDGTDENDDDEYDVADDEVRDSDLDEPAPPAAPVSPNHPTEGAAPGPDTASEQAGAAKEGQ